MTWLHNPLKDEGEKFCCMIVFMGKVANTLACKRHY